LPVSTKRVYKISLGDATDVSSISIAGTNTLPPNIKPVSKTLFLDIATALSPDNPSDWTKIAEKMEGLAIGPQLSDGSYALLIGTDNDFSVTQDSDTTIQSDVCSSADGSVASLVPIDGGCPEGQSLIPGFLYSFNVSSEDLGNYIPPQKKVPEPTAFAGLMLVSLSSLWLKRHKKSKA
jgi:hypothetical protein